MPPTRRAVTICACFPPGHRPGLTGNALSASVTGCCREMLPAATRHFKRARIAVPDRTGHPGMTKAVAKEGAMHGLMMNMPLMISSLIRHADVYHGDTEVVSRTVEGPIHRYTY